MSRDSGTPTHGAFPSALPCSSSNPSSTPSNPGIEGRTTRAPIHSTGKPGTFQGAESALQKDRADALRRCLTPACSGNRPRPSNLHKLHLGTGMPYTTNDNEAGPARSRVESCAHLRPSGSRIFAQNRVRTISLKLSLRGLGWRRRRRKAPARLAPRRETSERVPGQTPDVCQSRRRSRR